MQTLEYRFMDKSEWADGPWKDEPDKVQWQDEATGLPCLIRRGSAGLLCGYVGVSRTHPAYEVDYQQVDDLVNDVDVHGGLTFSGKCEPGSPEHGLCHRVEPGEDDDVWWLGFDCGHMFDVLPAVEAFMKEIRRDSLEDSQPTAYGSNGLDPLFYVYRDLSYVRSEVERLALQLIAIGVKEET